MCVYLDDETWSKFAESVRAGRVKTIKSLNDYDPELEHIQAITLSEDEINQLSHRYMMLDVENPNIEAYVLPKHYDRWLTMSNLDEKQADATAPYIYFKRQQGPHPGRLGATKEYTAFVFADMIINLEKS